MLALVFLVGACDADPGQTEAPSGADGMRHVVLDTDLAFDDIMALLYLARRDDVVIDAVTITGTGEVHCEPGVRNAIQLLALAGETDTPVACGRSTPLMGTNEFPAEWRAAVDDLTFLDLPASDRTADPRGAPGLLRESLNGDETLISLGPLTNVAEALRADPGLAGRVPEFFAMAGAIDVAGNTPNGVAEYNVLADPLAAKEVIQGMDVTLVPLDATNDVPFTSFFADALDAHATNAESRAVHEIIQANEEIFLSEGYSFWDTLATVLAFRPELATWEETTVVVTASLDSGAGWIDRLDGGTSVRFANDVPDPLAFERDYLSVLTGAPVTQVRPDPTITISFDGERCEITPRRTTAGPQVVAFVDDRDRDDTGILLHLGGGLTYEDLRRFLGADGSRMSPDVQPPEGVEALAFVETELAAVEASPPLIVGACASARADGSSLRVWLTSPVEVAEP